MQIKKSPPNIQGKSIVVVILLTGAVVIAALAWYFLNGNEKGNDLAEVPTTGSRSKSSGNPPPIQAKPVPIERSKTQASSSTNAPDPAPKEPENPDLEAALLLLENKTIPAQEFLDSQPIQRWSKRDPAGSSWNRVGYSQGP